MMQALLNRQKINYLMLMMYLILHCKHLRKCYMIIVFLEELRVLLREQMETYLSTPMSMMRLPCGEKSIYQNFTMK